MDDSKLKFNRKGFTLVELIVVITILAILWSIAFIVFSEYTATARNTTRTADMANIQKVIELYATQTWNLPKTTNGASITLNWNEVWSQWTFGDTSITEVWTISRPILDPLWGNEYVYSVSESMNQYQVAWVLEADSTGYIINTAHAASTNTAIVRWNYNNAVLSEVVWVAVAPSMVLRATDTTDLSLLTDEFVLDWGQNLPAWFDWSAEVHETYTSIEVYSCASNLGPIYLVEAIQNAVRGSSLATMSPYSEILDAKNNIDKLEVARQYLSGVSCVNIPNESELVQVGQVNRAFLHEDSAATCMANSTNTICYWADWASHPNLLAWSNWALWLASRTWSTETANRHYDNFESWSKVNLSWVKSVARQAYDDAVYSSDPAFDTRLTDDTHFSSCFLLDSWEVKCTWDNGVGWNVIPWDTTTDYVTGFNTIQFEDGVWNITDIYPLEYGFCAVDDLNQIYCFWDQGYGDMFPDNAWVVPRYTGFDAYSVLDVAIGWNIICALNDSSTVRCTWFKVTMSGYSNIWTKVISIWDFTTSAWASFTNVESEQFGISIYDTDGDAYFLWSPHSENSADVHVWFDNALAEIDDASEIVDIENTEFGLVYITKAWEIARSLSWVKQSYWNFEWQIVNFWSDWVGVYYKNSLGHVYYSSKKVWENSSGSYSEVTSFTRQ